MEFCNVVATLYLWKKIRIFQIDYNNVQDV